MKTIKIQLKVVALFFSVLILLQGCTVQKSASVTLDEAYRTTGKARVKTNDNKTQTFVRIGVDDGEYYGVRKIKGNYVEIPLDEKDIQNVRLKNYTLSTILTIVGIPIVIGGGLLLLLVATGDAGYLIGFHFEKEL